MGSNSTVSITRDYALEKIYTFLEEATDEALADVLEVLNDDMYEHGHANLDYLGGGYNFRIV